MRCGAHRRRTPRLTPIGRYQNTDGCRYIRHCRFQHFGSLFRHRQAPWARCNSRLKHRSVEARRSPDLQCTERTGHFLRGNTIERRSRSFFRTRWPPFGNSDDPLRIRGSDCSPNPVHIARQPRMLLRLSDGIDQSVDRNECRHLECSLRLHRMLRQSRPGNALRCTAAARLDTHRSNHRNHCRHRHRPRAPGLIQASQSRPP